MMTNNENDKMFHSREDEEDLYLEIEDVPADETFPDDESLDAGGSDVKTKKKGLTFFKRLRGWQKVLLVAAGVIVLMAAGVLSAYGIMRHVGHKQLMEAAVSVKPVFEVKEDEKDIYVNPNNMEEIYEILGVDEQGSLVVTDEDNKVYVVQEDGNVQEVPSDIAYTPLPEKDKPGDNTSNSGIKDLEINDHATDGEQTAGDDTYDLIYKGKKYIYNKDIINLLVLGIDKMGKVEKAKDSISGGQCDAIMLVSINSTNKTIKITAIPRDTVTKLWLYYRSGNFAYTGSGQICLQHAYGDGLAQSNERTVQAVSYLMYQLPIHSCTSVNMGGFGELNDAVGGITVESLYTFLNFEKGKTYKLMGKQAYDYVHYRDISRHYTAPERLERQKQYLGKFIPTALSSVKRNPASVLNLYNTVTDYTVTDLNASKMVDIASLAAGCRYDGIYTLQGYVDTSERYERFIVDEDLLAEYIITTFYKEVQ